MPADHLPTWVFDRARDFDGAGQPPRVVRPGEVLLVRDAFDSWVPAIATSLVEGAWKDGKKIHDFPVVWVDVTGADAPMPWPLEDVRLAVEEDANAG
jgi:hypothetical protein